MKPGRRKPAQPRRGAKAAKAPARRPARHVETIAQLRRERDEALAQQKATAEVLAVIAGSPGRLEPIFSAILERACDLCGADFGVMTLAEGKAFRTVALHDTPMEVFKARQREPVLAPSELGALGQVARTKRPYHVEDLRKQAAYLAGEYAARVLADDGGARTVLNVPMLRDGSLLGVIGIYRKQVLPFTDRQIGLVTSFAAEAVIAIENARLLGELQNKRRQLEEASRHKSQFLANMSHELRTPMNAILGYTELIIDGIYGEPSDRMRATLERVQRNGRHLLGLINDVLDISKIEAGQLDLSIGAYSLGQVVHEAFSAVESLAREKKIALKVDVSREMPQGRGDERRLTQVLLNLVGNAIKFTDQGEVAIAASQYNDTFKVAVRDTGPGISAADQGRIFEEFQQADNSVTKAKGGTGLGLAIARRIIEMHGGELRVESEVGKGSIFTFEIPVRAEQQVRQP